MIVKTDGSFAVLKTTLLLLLFSEVRGERAQPPPAAGAPPGQDDSVRGLEATESRHRQPQGDLGPRPCHLSRINDGVTFSERGEHV